MLEERLLGNLKLENNNAVEKLFENLDCISEINECDYIFIDKIDITQITNPLFKNKIILTKKLDNYFMLENINTSNTQMTKLNYKQIVDLLILNNSNQMTDDIKELIDQDTIIIKNMGNKVFYIEDKRREMKIIITQYEKMIFNGNGVNTQLQNYELLN